MSKVITFSRYFPSYHPRKGEETFFVEKFWEGIGESYFDQYKEARLGNFEPKYHTIRAGNRWKVGDKFSPRVWSGKPRRSKQIIIAPDIEIKKIWDFEMDECGIFSIDSKYLLYDFLSSEMDPEIKLAKNDGLSQDDFFHWFMPNFNKPKAFKGQIICWNENINYG